MKAMYFNKTIEQVLEELQVTREGLSKREAQKRKEKYGLNVIPSQGKVKIYQIFIKEFIDPLIILLLIAIITSLMSFLSSLDF